jgi:hypothetical protein
MLRRSPMRNGKTRITFSLPADEPGGVVSVVGDFNDWTPGRHVLVRRRSGTRSASTDLAAGTYLFRYLGAGGIWFDEPDADQLADGGSVIEI